MSAEHALTFTISISDCDPSGRWRPSSMLVAMQEAAESHSATFGLSRSFLLENDVVWILYRQQVQISAYPTFGDVVSVATWPGPLDGPIFPRYFRITRADGLLLGEAASSWILMNIQSRRPMRPSALPGKIPADATGMPPTMPLPGMLRVSDASRPCERTVQYSDLDVNGHMNNTRYVDWVCDLFPVETLTRRGLSGWQVNYISEAKPAETLVLSTVDTGDTTLVLGTRKDGRTVFEASATLRPEA